MKILWREGRLTLDAETPKEREALSVLVANLKVEIEAAPAAPAREPLRDPLASAGRHEVGVRPLAGEPGERSPLVGLQAGLRVLSKLSGNPKG